MNEPKNRYLLIHAKHLKNITAEDFVSLLLKTSLTADIIDKDEIVKNTCNQVNLKKNKIKDFTNVSIHDFHSDMIKGIEDNTKFLIFKN